MQFHRILATAAAAGLSASVYADSWPAPTERIVCFANRNHIFRIEPGPLDHSKFAIGTLYRFNEENKLYEIVWQTELLNPLSPVSVMVSDDGEYVVGINDYFRSGYGDHIVVIYGEEGKPIKKFGLRELFSDEEISRIPMTTSSLHWGGRHRLDEIRDILILQLYASDASTQPSYREKSIFLESGEFTIQQ